MVHALGHDLTTRVVEDNHSVDVRSFLVKGEEVANLQFMGFAKDCPPMMDDG
jgi:hypothetical protein